jgi:S1-C subfamily serine protease
MFARFFALTLAAALLQDTGTLQIRVTLVDATGASTPIPRVTLLISDNPATDEPRRVRTTADGTVELKLKPGSYTVESDQPVVFGGSAYTWTQMIEVVAGRGVILDLTAKNGEINAAPANAGGAIEADSAVLLSRFQNSVVEIWTPTKHASGFVIDRRGLIATSYHAIGGATDVEVEMTGGADRVKVHGTVLQSDRLTGAAIVRVNPQAVSMRRPIEPGCENPNRPSAAYQDVVTAVTSPMFGGKELADGEVQRVTAQAYFVDMRLSRDAGGSPVFTGSGELLGISGLEEVEYGSRRSREAFVIPVDQVCQTIAAAEKKMTAAPPPADHLPLELSRPTSAPVQTSASTSKPQLITLTSDAFDITVMTPAQAREATTSNARADMANWSDYIRDAPAMILIRVSPQFEESFWKTLARGAASTQGMNLPPLKSFTSSFLKMRVHCGDTEVTPIHPFIIERQVAEKASIREGLYAFDPSALGSQCGSVKVTMFSEKDPAKGDIKTLDGKLFDRLK